jgi:hypothetical protein
MQITGRMDQSSGAKDAQSVYKGNSFKPSAPQNVAPPKAVIVPWQKKK